MLAFPSMITRAAKEAGMKIPDLSNTDEFDAKEFPHFQVFCSIQLCRPIDWQASEPEHNSKIIASIPDDEIELVTLEKLLSMGIKYAQ